MFDHSIYKWFYAAVIVMILASVVLFVQLSTDLAHSPQPVAVVVIVLIVAIFGFIITGCLSVQRLLDTHPKPGTHIKYPPGAPASTAAACAQADTRARETYHALASGRGLPTQGSPTIPLQADEAIYGIFHIQYARRYGTQETYQHHQYLGRGVIPRLTMGAINTTRNNIAAGEAYERSRVQWREAQFTDAWVTNQRIIIYANGQLLEFWYGAILALYPDLSTCTLTLELREAEPLKLVGPDVASIAVLVQYFTTGIEGLTAQPALQHYRNTGTVYPGSQMQRKS